MFLFHCPPDIRPGVAPSYGVTYKQANCKKKYTLEDASVKMIDIRGKDQMIRTRVSSVMCRLSGLASNKQQTHTIYFSEMYFDISVNMNA